MAIKFLAVTFFFQLVVMLPIHHTDTGDWGLPDTTRKNMTDTKASSWPSRGLGWENGDFATILEKGVPGPTERMLWLYVFFVYLFSAFAIYLIVSETKKIIRVRQDYLGRQSTITDRTIRLSGIPEELRSEDLIKETIESLDIGKVDSVLLCRDWEELDGMVAKRRRVLDQLEHAWTAYTRSKGQNKKPSQQNDPNQARGPTDREGARLLDGNGASHEADSGTRPKVRIWFGTLNLQSRKVDAIDYYEEKLRKLDDQIKSSRNKVFKPTPLAFVTLDKTATAVSFAHPITGQRC